MKPKLYKETETAFDNNGLGGLSDAVSCTVEEERNGLFELTMEYPSSGELFDEVKNGAIILAKPNETSVEQPFRIYKITTPLNGVVTVYAKHISYQLSHIPASPFTANNVASALTGLKANAAEECPFTFWTDKSTVANFALTAPASIRSLLGGVQGSILDVYGGEYEFDRYTVKLHNSRGTDSGAVIAYGKNLTDINQENSIENTITGVYPYWQGSDGYVQLPEKIVSAASASNFPYPRTVPLDCTSQWQTKPTEAQLRTFAQSYVAKNNIGVPSVSIKVSFVALWQTDEFKDIAPIERLSLCDTATIKFEKLGVSAKAKVVSYVFDVLKDRYESITLGEASTNLADQIVENTTDIKKKVDSSQLDAAVSNATSWITGSNGGYVVMHKDANEQPYEILIMDNPDITKALKVWRWNKGGLGYSSNGYNGNYSTAITQDGSIVANFMTTGTLDASKATITNLNASNIKTGTLDASVVSVLNLIADNITSGVLKSKDGSTYFDLDNDLIQTDSLQMTARFGQGRVSIFSKLTQSEQATLSASGYTGVLFLKSSDGKQMVASAENLYFLGSDNKTGGRISVDGLSVNKMAVAGGSMQDVEWVWNGQMGRWVLCTK